MNKYLCRGIFCGFLVAAAVGCEPADSPEIQALEQAANAGGYDPAHPLLTTDGGGTIPDGGAKDASVGHDFAVVPTPAPKSSDCSYPGAAPTGSGVTGLLLLVGGLFVFRRRRS
jgi:MYXO-CTERM domain-containing protein